MATTLAPTSSERIFDVIFVDAPAAAVRSVSVGVLARADFSADGVAAAAAACAARRAAAMKLDEPAGSREAPEISWMALSDAAMRSDGEMPVPGARVPGSSG